MRNVRFHPDVTDPHVPGGTDSLGGSGGGGRPRFNVLLTEDRPRDVGHWTRELPRLLAPQGVAAYIARTGREAIRMAEEVELHAAVIDLATPLAEGQPVSTTGDTTQLWLLELFRRLPRRPPTIIVHGGFFSQRKIDRLLSNALRLGAFSVLAKPIDLEQLLRVFQSMVDRRYAGAWPAMPPNAGGAGKPNTEQDDF